MTAATSSDGRTLYVTDLDFTLLRSDATLSDFTIDTINSFVDRGGLFTYATARSPRSARRVAAGLDLRLPVIAYGGVTTVDAADGHPREIRTLPGGALDAILDAVARQSSIEPLIYSFEDGRDWIRWHPERESAGVRAFLDRRPGDRRFRPITADDPLAPTTVFYLTILGDRTALHAVHEALRPALPDCAMFLYLDHGYPNPLSALEIHHADATKAHAVRRLAARLSTDRLVVFGDNHNDIPLFRAADEGHAVANAVPELLAIATTVIDSNDHDGVARWLLGKR